MKFYSHIYDLGDRQSSKLLIRHLQNVKELALKNIPPFLQLEYEPDILKNLIRDLSCYHDLGKYSDYFQNYLHGKDVNQSLSQHAIAGAIYWMNKYQENPLLAFLGFYLIRHHHNNLSKITNEPVFGINFFDKIILEVIKNVAKNSPYIEIENFQKQFLKIPSDNALRELRKATRKNFLHSSTPKHYFTYNYLFSKLIEADKLEASNTPYHRRQPINPDLIDQYVRSLAQNAKTLSINSIRNEIRNEVVSKIGEANILNYKIFTLTAPTGSGKTLTSLEFALRLKALIEKKEKFEPQIIYSLPFISIIEQNYKVYQSVFRKSLAEIFAHYQFSDLSEAHNEREYYKQLMMLNTWQADIIITTFVRFFETLISNQNKNLLKFHHLAGSIIILDEIQSIAVKKMPLIGIMLYYLTEYLGARIILITATQPEIFRLSSKIPSAENIQIQTLELLENHEKYFQQFNRTKIIPLLDKTITKSHDFYKIFNSKKSPDKSALVVCNTVNRSIEVFHELKTNYKDNIFYLSTNIVPAQRMEIINKIKQETTQGNKPVLVSTQAIEAGVDLDFDMGFRDIGPISSIIQVAGRINRNNDPHRQLAPLYLVEFIHPDTGISESVMIYDALTHDIILDILNEKKEIPEKEYLNLVNEYFQKIFEKRSFDESINFYNSILKLIYTDEDYSIDKFKMIDQQPWLKSVFVPLNVEAIEALEAYRKLLSGEISKAAFSKNYKKTFYSYIINVPDKYASELDLIDPSNPGLLYIRPELLNDYYDPETGFKRKKLNGDSGIYLL